MFIPPKFDVAAYERDPKSFSLEFGAAVEHEKAVSLLGVNQHALTQLYQEIGLFFDSRGIWKKCYSGKSREGIYFDGTPSALQESLSIVYQNLNDIALVVVKALANYFENDRALREFNKGDSLLHLRRYDPMSRLEILFSPGKLRLGGHTHSFCSLLPPATVEGLEILTAAKQWEEVPPEEDCALFLPGSRAAFYEFKEIHGVEHRVVAPPKEKRRQQRYASVFEFL